MITTHKASFVALVAAIVLLGASCQKMDRPQLADYPKDTNPPGGPLNFYAAFDNSAVDSIRASFPNDNPLKYTEGVQGMAIQGEPQKFVKYLTPNDWAARAESFSTAFWYKHDGQTKNNVGSNGPEYIFSLKSSSGHWSGASMLVFLEGDNKAAGVKIMIADSAKADNWFTWENEKSIAGLLDNAWHHIALTYDAGTSAMTLYVDGKANSETRNWKDHKRINFDNTTITEFRVGAGPGTSYDTDDWLSSTWKGGIDQLRLYSIALSATEVAALYNGKM